ncbi:MAG: MBL fold metallo-hydrolase [Holophagaceae bacterium]|nr:MBL fold metallo-hydrolase [Holophagaceae bacterium]
MRIPSIAALSLVLVSLSASSLPAAPPVRVAQHATPKPDPHKIEKLADNVYCIFGEGGNIGLIVTEHNAILIDDQFAPLVPGLLKVVRSVTDKPIKYLINTHHHGDHVGGNIALEKQVQVIVAHTNVRHRMELEQAKLEPIKRGGLPEITFGDADPKVRSVLAINLDGVEVHLAHFGPGHTDGDVLVGIPGTHVMHMGDIFFNGSTPYIDLNSGGSLAGMIANLDAVLAFLPEDSKVIPGHGPVGGKKDVARARDFLKAVRKHVNDNPNKTGKELDASFDHKAWSDFHDLAPFLTWDKFFDIAAGRSPKK